MIRDITIGQYYPANSVLHRLDPRVKIVGTFVISDLAVCAEKCAGLSGGNAVSGRCHSSQ